MKKSNIIIGLLAALSFSGCNKFLNLKPIDSPTEDTFYADAGGLQGALVSCYDALQSDNCYGLNMIVMAENRGDNIQDNGVSQGGGIIYQIDAFNDRADNSVVRNTYWQHYVAIYRCNILLDKAPGIMMDAGIRNQIMGQALFIRALCYFNIVRLWGKAPLIIKTQTPDEARENKRSEVANIYAQIISDLNTAGSRLPAAWPAVQRGKATSHAAAALLAKVYLYQGKYDLVVTTISQLVNDIYASQTVGLVPQTTTFPNSIKTSKDVLFAVQYLAGGLGEGTNFNNRYRNQEGTYQIALAPNLFESGDNRKDLVKPTPYQQQPGKFAATPIVESTGETGGDMPVLRCAEVLLIYAEAQNELSAYPNAEAFKAINAVRANSGISPLNASTTPTKNDLKKAIWKERRLELALECDRWFDIVRTGQFPVIFPLVPAHKVLYAIPQTEINNINDKTGWQNEGY